ncbi:MAG TPA: hypothetical protein VGL75_16260 [Acidothermaceae bacterium]
MTLVAAGLVLSACSSAQSNAQRGAGSPTAPSPLDTSPSAVVSPISVAPRTARALASSGSSSFGTSAFGVVLAIDDSGQFRIEDLGSAVVLHTLPIATVAQGPSLIASARGGWVVSYAPTPGNGESPPPARLAFVTTSGAVTPFGPTFPQSSPISGLAVSPDGTSVAIALMQVQPGATPAHIQVMAMPGHLSPTRSWPVDDIDVNEIMSLSFAPDGRTLSYIAGSQTGAGIGGNPSTLDTASDATQAPTSSTWPGNTSEQCMPDGASWLGTSGQFAVVVDCPPNGVLTTVDPVTGARTGTDVALPQYACLDANIHPAADASAMLISRCNRVYLVAHGAATALDPDLVDAAWANS